MLVIEWIGHIFIMNEYTCLLKSKFELLLTYFRFFKIKISKMKGCIKNPCVIPLFTFERRI